MNEIREIIREYGLSLRADSVNVSIAKYAEKKAKANLNILKSKKAAIIEELKTIKAEKEAKKAKEEEEKKQELLDLKSGKKMIEVSYQDGEYLTGYAVWGQSADLLESIGLARYVSGWGYIVDDKIIKDLGKNFSFPDASEYIRPVIEKKAKEKKERIKKEEKRKADIFSTAKKINEKQILDQFSVECCDPKEECNTDIVTMYAMPDGSTEKTCSHTW